MFYKCKGYTALRLRRNYNTFPNFLKTRLSFSNPSWDVKQLYVIIVGKFNNYLAVSLPRKNVLCHSTSRRTILSLNGNHIPASMRHWPNSSLLLAHRLRRWPNSEPTLGMRRWPNDGFFWPTVYDVCPTVNQRWANVSCLLRYSRFPPFLFVL